MGASRDKVLAVEGRDSLVGFHWLARALLQSPFRECLWRAASYFQPAEDSPLGAP